MDFSLIFKDLRRSKKLTQIDFAKKLAISRSTIAQIESSHAKPSREVILRILESFDVSEDLRVKFEEYANGNKPAFIENANSPEPLINERIPEYNKEIAWETYIKLVANKKIIMCQCILLKETHNYEFTSDERNKLTNIETGISYLSQLVLGRLKFRDYVFKNFQSVLYMSDELIEEFSNALLFNYKNRIRDFKDLFYTTEYKDDEFDITF